ncbi:MAG: right-handed parallel beta-helix repeat-containing protein [Ardenticatenales bacterium]
MDRQTPRRLTAAPVALATVLALAAALSMPAFAAPTARRAQGPIDLCADATLTNRGEFTQTMTLAPGTYVAPNCSLRVKDVATLTLNAGTIIEFGEDTNFQVNGRLNVAGANAGDVVFRSAATVKNRGDWQGVRVQSKGSAVFRGLELRHTGQTGSAAIESDGAVSIENSTIADGDGSGVVVRRAGGTIRNSRIANMTKVGLEVQSPSSQVQTNMNLDGVTFQDNRGAAVQSATTVQWTLSNSAASGNALNAIMIQGGTADRALTLRGGDLPYVITGVVTHVKDLTIEPNAVIKFANGSSGLKVRNGARLVAEGGEGTPIVFSASADDSACIFAGQASPRITCNTDNDDKEPQPGSWQKVEVEDSAVAASLKNVMLRYGDNETLLVRAPGTVIDHATIEHANGVALRVNNSAPFGGTFLTITNGMFKNNVGSAVDLDSSVPITVSLTNSAFADNAFTVRMSADVELLNGGNTATGHGVKGYTVNQGEAKASHTWRAGDLPWVLPATIRLGDSAATLTIQPSAVVKLGSLGTQRGLGGLDIERGRLIVGGADASKRVLITSIHDDACDAADTAAGCDTNGDEGGSQPLSGDWTWVHIGRLAQEFRMTNALVRYGGATPARYAMVELEHANCIVSDSEFAYSSSSGIAIDGVQPRIEHNIVRANGKSGIRIVGGDREVRVTIKDNAIYDNNGGAIEIDANVEVDLSGNTTTIPSGYTATNRQLNGIVIGGNAQSSTTWHHSPDMPFIINRKVDVLNQSVLTIEPGVVIKFTLLGSISTSRGTLIAQGTSDNKIIFTSVADSTVGGVSVDGSGPPGPKDWGGLEFTRPGTARSGTLENVEIRYASGGSPLAAVNIQQDNVRIDHVTISNGADAGIAIDDANGVSITNTTLDHLGGAAIYARTLTNLSAIVKDNTITNCGVAAQMDANAQLEISGNTLSGNRINGIMVKGSIKTKRTWYADDMTYVMDDVSVDSGGNLLVQPGTMVKAITDKGLQLRVGALQLEGTAERPIVFTSIRDDRCSATVLEGCDTDSNDQSKEPGDWRGISVDAGTNNSVLLSHVVLLYGGQSTAAFDSKASSTTLKDSQIAYANKYGSAFNDVRTMVVQGNYFHHNGAAGVLLSGVTAGQLSNNIFTDNARPVEHGSKGIVTTKDNVAIGNAADAMLFTVDSISNAQVWANDLPRDITRLVTLSTSTQGGGNPDLTIDSGLLMRFAPGAGIKARAGRFEVGGAYFTSDGSDLRRQTWSGLSFEGTSRGKLSHNFVAMAGNGSVGAIDINSEGQGQPIQVNYNSILRSAGSAVTVSPENNNVPRPAIVGNLIAGTTDSTSGYAFRLSGDGDTVIQYNRISDFPNGISINKKVPKINFNNFLGVRGKAVDNTTASNCVDATNNWWGDLTGPKDNMDGTGDRCKDKNPGAKGSDVSEYVDYNPWLKAPPPPVPMLDLPRCGYTNKSTVTIAGHAGPGAQVVVYDADSKIDPIITADSGGSFRQEITLSNGVHDISVETVGTAPNSDGTNQDLKSPRLGYRVVRIDTTPDIDPASIVFQYGTQTQPLRDATGCAVACGGASSGRVTLPPSTPVVVVVDVKGSPSSVEFVQAGRPNVAFTARGNGWKTDPFQPAPGAFTIRINGQSGSFCQGFVYFGGLGRVFSDTGAKGDPIVDVGFEENDPRPVSDTLRMGAFVRTARKSASGRFSATTSQGVDADGKPLPYVKNAEYVLSFVDPIDLAAIPAPFLTFKHQYSLATGDTITVEGRTSSADPWVTLGKTLEDSNGWKIDKGSQDVWTGVGIALDEFARSSRFELRFILKANSDDRVAEGWYLDEITIRPGGANNRRYDTGEPLVAGAQVTLLQRDQETGEYVTWDASPTGQQNPQTTDTDGRFGFFNLPAGEYRLLVARGGNGGLAPFLSDAFIVLDGSFVIDVPLTGGPKIYLPYVVRGTSTR